MQVYATSFRGRTPEETLETVPRHRWSVSTSVMPISIQRSGTGELANLKGLRKRNAAKKSRANKRSNVIAIYS